MKNQLITQPGLQGDGVTFWDGMPHVLSDSVIDLSGCDLDDIDEALGITYGSSAVITNCVLRGAGKLVLCGCGDKDQAEIERGKTVVFRNCIFEDFGRRGPEVQDGMKVFLENCLIRNWGAPERFTVRSFGAWAHGEGSSIIANNCIFWQDFGRFGQHWFKDLIGHIGQAFNDRKLAGLFSKDAWRPGNCRGLIASDGGYVEANNCYANYDWIVIENLNSEMHESDALRLKADLYSMAVALANNLGWSYAFN